MRTRKAVFLDLQGTLGGEGLGNILEFAFFPGAIEAIRRINHAHLLAILVTNQSHVAKGLLTMAHFWRRIAEIKLELAGGKAQLDAVYCCPHATQHLCTCQKPQPGMVLQAKRDFHLELDQCYVVGDSGAWDMALAKAVGSKAILVRTGLGESSLGAYRSTWQAITPDFVADDIMEAAKWILMQEEGCLVARISISYYPLSQRMITISSGRRATISL